MFSVKNNFLTRLFVLTLSCELINLINHLINSDVNSYNLIFKGAFAICPSKCHCDNLNLKVLCSNANLDLIPMIFNPELQVLQLDSNVIQKIKNSSFNVYGHIKNLNLSFNRIILIEDNSFIYLKKLKVMSQLFLSSSKRAHAFGKTI
jgi:leucine-rich repeat-containing protein 3B